MDEAIKAMNGMDLDGRNIIAEKLSLKVQVETEVVIAVVIVALIGTMVVQVEVESASSVTSLGILPGSALVKGAEEVGFFFFFCGVGVEGEEAVVVGAMVVIEVVTNQ
ncbi:hypothetical protein BT93_H2699 [Corymbia citriodora subsp. variegata]|nr:hypothetical protein BT93_H2699 [Corymbia citriodora subsp. variegata]